MPEDSSDLKLLVQRSELVSVSFFEMSARKFDEAQVTAGADTDDFEIAPIYSLQTASRDDDTGFRVRIKVEVELPAGSLVVDAAAEYVVSEISAKAIDPDLLVDFVNEVSAMAMFPYLRQAVADMSQRIFWMSLLLPLLQRGQLVFQIIQPDEAVALRRAAV